MNLTEYAANALLDGGSIPATLYVQLHTGNPGTDGTGNVATTSDRVAVTRDAAVDGSAASDAAIAWGAAAATETVTHLSLWDASTAGNPWFAGALTVSAELISGSGAEIAVGLLILSLDTWT